MEAEAHLTLDSSADLRNRFRRNYSSRSDYVQPMPTRRGLINDFEKTIVRKHPVQNVQKISYESRVAPKPIVSTPSSMSQLRHQPSVTKPAVIATQSNEKKIHSDEILSQRKTKHSHSKQQSVLLVLAVLMIAIGGYISLSSWHTNRIAQAQAVKLTAEANKAAATQSSTAPASVPNTVKPSAAAVSSYAVGPTMPKYLIIPKLNVNARILSVGVTSTGALATPNNVYDTAWYNESALPGQPGAMLIDGHVSSWTAHGVFYGIKSLVAGDMIKVERGDGTVFNYKVVSSQVYPSGNVNMNAAIAPVVPGTPGLNLITCTGDVIPGTNLFNERIMVFAEQV